MAEQKKGSILDSIPRLFCGKKDCEPKEANPLDSLTGMLGSRGGDNLVGGIADEVEDVVKEPGDEVVGLVNETGLGDTLDSVTSDVGTEEVEALDSLGLGSVSGTVEDLSKYLGTSSMMGDEDVVDEVNK